MSRTAICYVIASIDTPRAGTERHLLQLFDALDKDKLNPLIIVLRHSKWTRGDYCDVPIEALGIRSMWSPRSWLGIIRLARIIRSHGTEIAEFYFVEGQFLGALASWFAGVRSRIAWRRDLAYQYGAKEKWMLRLTNPLITQFLANSDTVRDAIASAESIDPRRFKVIRNGIDLEAFDQNSAAKTSVEFRRLTSDKLVVTLVANLRPIKNVRCFLDAASMVTKSRSDVVFSVIGSGGEETALREYANQLGISERVIWNGAISEVASYLKQSDIGCLCSDSEGLPNAIVEYMAAGLPVIATDVGGVAEVVCDGRTGLLINKGDSQALAKQITRLLDDRELRSQMGAAGRQRIENEYSLGAQMRAYEQLCLEESPHAS